MLNPSSPTPLYRQLADLIAAGIRNGELRVGTRIMSEPELARRYGLGRPTVRQATEVLVRSGMLERRRGSGTFVALPPRQVDLFALEGTLAAFRGAGLSLTTRVLSGPVLAHRRAGEGVGRSEPTPPATIQLARLGSLDGTPVLHELLCLEAAVFPGLQSFDLSGRSLSRLIAEHYLLRPSGGVQTLAVARPSAEVARALKVGPRTPLLIIERRLDFPGAPGAILATMTCRTDRVRWAHVLSADAVSPVDDEHSIRERHITR